MRPGTAKLVTARRWVPPEDEFANRFDSVPPLEMPEDEVSGFASRGEKCKSVSS